MIADRVVNAVPPKDRDIAMVFQSYALYPSMTVRQNITFGMECRNIAKPAREAALTRVAPDSVMKAGEVGQFAIDTRKLCLFDPQTEMLLA